MKTFLDGYKANFETLKRAVRHGQLALVECRDSRTGGLVPTLCAMCEDNDGTVEMVPLGRLHTIEDLNTLQAPNPEGGFFEPCEWSPV